MIRPATITLLLGVGLLVLAGCTGSDQQESPTPTLSRTPNPQTTPTLDPNPSATPTPSLIPTPTEETPFFGLVPNQIITLLPKDAIPALLDPKFTSVESGNNQMDDFEHVIGVSINGDNRAYPIRMLSRHEIVNDVVGGEFIAVTW